MEGVMYITTEYSTFKLHANETLLEGLERTGHQVEYQCRSGYCGSCRVTLRSGRVKYTRPPLANLREHEILTCCSQPLENLKLELNLKLVKSA